MLMLSRHILAILMPFVVVVIFPNWLLKAFGHGDTHWNTDLSIAWLPRLTGIVLVLLGLILFVWCVGLFAKVGWGTLAPWDPTRNLVGVGPYRYVRNPMISSVALMLIGRALFRGSWVLGVWVCTFIIINHIYFVLSEEPGLEKHFKEQYRAYKENVPRWIPRMKPWLGK